MVRARINIGAIHIELPPLCETFELPTRVELRRLRRGDFVKLIFVDQQGKMGERMWVQITDLHSYWEWEGIVDNDPVNPSSPGCGTNVRFHPLCIISYERLRDIADQIDKGRLFT